MKKGGKIIISKRQGQVAMEYLAIFAIAALMSLPLILIFVTQNNNIQMDITVSQAHRAATKIKTSAEEVYYMGPPAQKTIRVNFPSGVASAYLNNDTINMQIYTANVNYPIIESLPFSMQGDIEEFPGIHVLVLNAVEDPFTLETYVNITEKR